MRNSLLMASVVFLSCSTVSFATPVTINNHSFETPDLSTGATWTNTITDWTNTSAAGTSFIERIPGFSSDGAQHLGIQGGATVYQDVGLFADNTTYTMTVNIGNRNNNFTRIGNTSTWEILDTLGTVYASGVWDAEAGTADGTFGPDQSIVYSTPASGGPTGAIRLALRQVGEGRSHWDNVRLDYTAVPEPSTLALLALGGGSLMMGRRRRRRVDREFTFV